MAEMSFEEANEFHRQGCMLGRDLLAWLSEAGHGTGAVTSRGLIFALGWCAATNMLHQEQTDADGIIGLVTGQLREDIHSVLQYLREG